MNISKKNIAYYVLFICLFGLLGNDLMESKKKQAGRIEFASCLL